MYIFIAFIVGLLVGYFLIPKKSDCKSEIKCKHEELQEITCFGDKTRRFKCKLCGEIFERSE